MNSVKLFIRTDQLTKDGRYAIYVRLIINRRKKDVSLRIYVKPKDWNFKRNLVNKSDPESIRKNRLIKKYKNKAENIVDDCFFNNETLTFYDFEARLLNKEYNDDSFLEFVFDEIVKRNFAKETNRTYNSQITKLQQF
ncbi:MAG: Arm DNA-binding domain-containing protein [Bacteroidota bacterium]